MGSYDAAVMTGFICRLCSELNRNVVHIYSVKGRELQLAEKINLMPISLEPQDSLPKTICQSCVTQLDSQYRLIQQLKRSRDKILEHVRIKLHQARIRLAESQRRMVSNSNCENNTSTSESCDEPENNSQNDPSSQ